MGDVIRLNFNRGGFAGHTVDNLLRQAAVFRYRPYDQTGAALSSHFGDLPYLPDNSSWPHCSGCGRPLTFMAQFNYAQLQIEAPGDYELLELYYCFHCKPFWDVDGRGFYAALFSIDPLEPRLAAKKMFIDNSGNAPHPCRVEAVLRDDYPQAAEARELLVLDEAAAESYASRYKVISSGKLGGWPAWKRLPDAPTCRYCGSDMRFAAQIASGEAHGLRFDGSGTLYLFRCDKLCSPQSFSLVIQDE